MRICVTGPSGFIGKNLVPLLSRHELFLLDKRDVPVKQKNVRFLKADLADAASWSKPLKDFAPQACIHLAWKGLPDYSLEACLANFNMTVRLFEQLSLMRCQKIFCAGTCWEYGSVRGKVREDACPRDLGLFASFKTGLCLIGENLARQNKTDFIWGRIFFVYGPGQRETSLIPSCYSSLSRRQSPEVKNPDTVCDFIHISDVVLAIKALIEAEGVRGVFNIGSGSPTQVGRVCEYIGQALHFKTGFSYTRKPARLDGFWADISKIQKRTGWQPKMGIQKGVEETLRELKKTYGNS